MLKISIFLYYKNKATGDIFEEKGKNFLYIKNPTMIQLNRIQISSQTPNHVEIIKILKADSPLGWPNNF